MDIKKTHTTQEVLNAKKTSSLSPEVRSSDSVNISSQAKLLAEVGFYKKLILNKIPDVRADRVADAKEKLANGYYSSDKVLHSVSRTLSSFLDADDK